MKTINIEGIIDRITFRRRNSVGVAFSGGGARGFSHIGVIMAMEKFGIKPDIISGVSAGSIAAVLYGAGLSPLDMRQCFVDANKFADFREWTIPKDGIFKLNKFAKLLDSWLPVKFLEDMAIPTAICATNLDRGTQVGWCRGEIVPRGRFMQYPHCLQPRQTQRGTLCRWRRATQLAGVGYPRIL